MSIVNIQKFKKDILNKGFECCIINPSGAQPSKITSLTNCTLKQYLLLPLKRRRHNSRLGSAFILNVHGCNVKVEPGCAESARKSEAHGPICRQYPRERADRAGTGSTSSVLPTQRVQPGTTGVQEIVPGDQCSVHIHCPMLLITLGPGDESENSHTCFQQRLYNICVFLKHCWPIFYSFCNNPPFLVYIYRIFSANSVTDILIRFRIALRPYAILLNCLSNPSGALNCMYLATKQHNLQFNLQNGFFSNCYLCKQQYSVYTLSKRFLEYRDNIP